MAYKFQMGLADLSGSIELTSATAGLKVSDQSGALKAEIDVAGVISGSAIQGATLATNNVVRVNAGGQGTFVGVAAGGAITTATDITGNGALTMGTVTMSGFAVDADGDTNLKSLAVDDGSTIGCDTDPDLLTFADQSVVIATNAALTYKGTAITADGSELNLVDGSVANSVVNSKAVIYGSGGQVAAATVTATGLITADSLSTGEFTVSAAGLATAVGVVAGGPISGATTITGSGQVSAGTYVGAGGLFSTSLNGSVTAGGVSGSLASSLLSLSVNTGAASISSAGAASFSTLAASGLASVASISMDDGSTLGPDSVADLWTFSADGDTVQKDGTYDFNLASHDGTNGLKLAGTLVVATAAEIDYNADVTAGTAIASKSIVLDASKDSTGMRSLTGSGDAYFGGLYSDGALRAAGNAQFDGSVALGNATGDNLQFNGRAASNFVPDSDSARDLGADALRWSTIYVDSIVGASVAWDVVKCHSADTISASAELAIILEGNGITVNLPAATTGRNIRVKLSASVGDVLIAPASGEIIEGLAADAKVRLESTGSSVTFACMETDGWVIL